MIHVAYGTSNLYAKFAGTSMLSIFENTTSDVTVHILHDNTLTNDNRDKFSWIAGRYNQRVEFHNVEEICGKDIEKIRNGISKENLDRFSIATFFRLFAAQAIPENVVKIIYLDSDTIINLDIAEMWRFEPGDKPLAAVLEWEDTRVSQYGLSLCREGLVKPEDYFNAGITIMNLERLRREEKRIRGGVEFIINRPQHHLVDQDMLNYCFSTEYLKLPSKFNCWVRRERASGKTAIERKIYHFIGKGDSLGLDARDNFHRLYWKYFAMTPWFNAEMILNLGAGVIQMHVAQQNFAVRVSALLSGKTRAFFTEPASVPALKQIFATNDAEEILTLTSDESVKQLAEAMNVSRGRRVFFVLVQPGIYVQLKEILTQAGFVEWRDFVNALEFLSEAQGVPLNAWQIIKNM